MNPLFPIYIVSKGRWEKRLTAMAMEKLRIPYRIVVESHERDKYADVIDPAKILVLPFSNLGQGSIPARNWIWEHSISQGEKRHWVLDDNISGFRRYFQGHRIRVTDGSIFKAAEDFVERYENIALAGMQYSMFAVSGCLYHGRVLPPILFNTRIYSCILILNRLPLRWRGRYNEDTDLSLQALKHGWCTALFYAFLCDKRRTMTMNGGNTDELYRQDSTFDGRLEMARSLQRQHPDVVKITRKWGRWQHQVNYKPFKTNRLKLKPEFIGKKWEPNEYGMKLVQVPVNPPYSSQAAR